jgi:multiple sugar transport system substrate-binding protein
MSSPTTGRSRTKSIAVIASACATSMLAASCGSHIASTSKTGSKPYAGQTLTVADYAPSGAKIRWSYYSSPSEELNTVETATVSGSGPDIISYGSSFVGTLAATGEFPALSAREWKSLGGKSSFIGSNLYYSYGGSNTSDDIGIPNETNPYVLAYNTVDFKKAGIKSPPKTWSQLVADGKAIQRTNPGVAGVGIDPADSFDPWKNVYYLALQLGGAGYVAPNGKSTLLDSPQVQQATSFYFSLEYKYHVAPAASLTWNSAQMASAFLDEKVGMELLASYGIPVMGTKLQGHLGYALLPTIPYGLHALPPHGRPIETIPTGEYWAIPKYAGSKRALALEFEKLSVSTAVQVQQYKLLGWMPVTYPGATAVEKISPSAKLFVADEEKAIPNPKIPAWSYVESGVEAAINNIASHLAQSGTYSASYASGQLGKAQSAADAHIGS